MNGNVGTSPIWKYRATVNVEIFAQYIISRRVLGALKYDVSEKINHYGASRNNCYMRENLSARKGHLGPDARKFSSAKVSTFTVSVDDTVLWSCMLV